MLSIELTHDQADEIVVQSILSSLDYNIDPDNFGTIDEDPMGTWSRVAGFTHVLEYYCTKKELDKILTIDRYDKMNALALYVTKDVVNREA